MLLGGGDVCGLGVEWRGKAGRRYIAGGAKWWMKRGGGNEKKQRKGDRIGARVWGA